MPRVTEEHLTARRRQILDAARRCFLRTGFHRTSMQDVLAEANLSAGAVYRYFKGKNEIVMAIADEVLGGVLGGVTPQLRADPPEPPTTILAGLLRELEPQLGPDGVLRMAVQVWGEAMHDKALADYVDRVYRGVRTSFVEYAERAGAAGLLPAGTDPAEVGPVLFGLVPGYIMQRSLTGGPPVDEYVRGIEALLSR